MNRVKIVSVLVLDQDAAIEFFTKKFGFELREDKAFGETRWVTVSLPGESDLTLALEQASSADDKAIVGRQAGSHAFLAIDTSDCRADYERLKQKGIRFHGEPHSGPWGTAAECEDLYGNKIFISQES